MKNWLAKVFFKDAPAQGAWFAVTLWGLGLYVIFSLLLALTASGLVPFGTPNTQVAAWVTLGLLVVLTIYLGLMLFRFYYQSCQGAPRREISFWVVFALYGVMVATSINYGGAAGFAITTALFGVWLFPLLLIPKVRWCCYLAHALSWTIGALLLIVMLIRAGAQKNDMFGIIPGKSEPGHYAKMIASYELSGGGWIFLVLLSLVLIVAGYLLTAKIFGDSQKVPFRNMFGKGVLTLWGFAVATYLIFLVMADIASRQTAQDIKDLEQRFGRPMTAAAIGKLYYGNDQPDPEFWKKIATYRDQCDVKVDSIDFGYNPDTVPAPLLAQWRKQFDNANLAAWEQAFAGNIPPEARQYETGTLVYMTLAHLNSLRQFARLELWRIRFALMDNDIKSALAAYGRMTNADDFLLRETSLIGGLVWIACQSIRLDALQLLLESGQLTDAQLQMLAADLQATQKQIPVMHERSLYSEAVFGMDVFDMIGRGFEAYGTKHKTPPYQTLRFLVPQLWWYAVKDKSCMARHYNVSSFAEMAEPDAVKNGMIISGMMLPALKPVAAKFDSISARLLAAGVVIRAIEYQRQHGEYPKTLNNLPLDPFNNQPLQYRVGPCELERSAVIRNGDDWKIVYQSETVPALICWSVGHDQINSNGLRRNHITRGTKKLDDISFMVQIPKP